MNNNSYLSSEKTLTRFFKSKGVTHWDEAIAYVQKLPYGRNSNREDLSLVLTEQKGSCSSKHALLKQLATENNISGIILVLALYRMTEANTPGIAPLLTEHALRYIPEAHCYLKIDGIVMDGTSEAADFKMLQKDIFSEIAIEPYQVASYKVNYHQLYLKEWIASQTTFPYSFSELWDIRESCIQKLTRL